LLTLVICAFSNQYSSIYMTLFNYLKEPSPLCPQNTVKWSHYCHFLWLVYYIYQCCIIWDLSGYCGRFSEGGRSARFGLPRKLLWRFCYWEYCVKCAECPALISFQCCFIAGDAVSRNSECIEQWLLLRPSWYSLMRSNPFNLKLVFQFFSKKHGRKVE
jgi:hypothetical protein